MALSFMGETTGKDAETGELHGGWIKPWFKRKSNISIETYICYPVVVLSYKAALKCGRIKTPDEAWKMRLSRVTNELKHRNVTVYRAMNGRYSIRFAINTTPKKAEEWLKCYFPDIDERELWRMD